MRLLAASVRSAYPFLETLGFQDVNAGCFDGKEWKATGQVVDAISPITNKPIGPKVQKATIEDAKRSIKNMMDVKKSWMLTPAPERGLIVREIGDELRRFKEPLGQLLALEVGKILAEGKGEVQEYIDICDFATGLARQLPGSVMPSERPGHFMMEQWHPLGAIGIIAAFNFPLAVPGWNSAISLVCGNTQIWKCASTTMLTAIATQRVMNTVLERHHMKQVSTLVCGPSAVGQQIVDSPDVQLVSFTGSCSVGQKVNESLARRFGRAILELGGNNAIIVMEDGDMEMALRSTVFGAVGTCGQRCTTARRLYVHESKYDEMVRRLIDVYGKLKIGNPLKEGVLVGPLHTLDAVKEYEDAIAKALKEGGKILYGGKAFHNDASMPGPNYVMPTLIETQTNFECIKEEAFVPILYVMKIKTIEEAIHCNNNVTQGLSSSLFTRSLRYQHLWAGPCGSDCGIVNVNVPTNGAEIGGAFGGEKATGGGRESGSDAWKQYCRRATSTVNYSTQLPLAQGINFDA